MANFTHLLTSDKTPREESGPLGRFGGCLAPGAGLQQSQSDPPLPPTGAVPAHHHPHHERRGQALRLPLGLPHLPVFLHDDAGHPLLKLLHSGTFKLSQERNMRLSTSALRS